MTKIRHTGIVTNNIKKSLWFWKNQLNFKVIKSELESGKTIDSVLGYKNVLVNTIKLSDQNGNLIELLYFRNSPKNKKNKIKPYTVGLTHVSLTVKNINKIYKKLIKKKVLFNSKPKKSADEKVLMTYCRTPEGCFVEMVEELK